jgi:hypothetical protein
MEFLRSTAQNCFSEVQSPEEICDAINNIRGWWSEEIDVSTDTLGAQFKFHYKDLHRSAQKIIELVSRKDRMACVGYLH